MLNGCKSLERPERTQVDHYLSMLSIICIKYTGMFAAVTELHDFLSAH